MLLVEPIDELRHIYGRLLATDYDVIEVRTAETALEVPRPVDVLVTSVELPASDGFELAERLRERVPGIAVVLMSNADDRPPRPGDILLSRPFSNADLLDALHVRN